MVMPKPHNTAKGKTASLHHRGNGGFHAIDTHMEEKGVAKQRDQPVGLLSSYIDKGYGAAGKVAHGALQQLESTPIGKWISIGLLITITVAMAALWIHISIYHFQHQKALKHFNKAMSDTTEITTGTPVNDELYTALTTTADTNSNFIEAQAFAMVDITLNAMWTAYHFPDFQAFIVITGAVLSVSAAMLTVALPMVPHEKAAMRANVGHALKASMHGVEACVVLFAVLSLFFWTAHDNILTSLGKDVVKDAFPPNNPWRKEYAALFGDDRIDHIFVWYTAVMIFLNLLHKFQVGLIVETAMTTTVMGLAGLGQKVHLVSQDSANKLQDHIDDITTDFNKFAGMSNSFRANTPKNRITNM